MPFNTLAFEKQKIAIGTSYGGQDVRTAFEACSDSKRPTISLNVGTWVEKTVFGKTCLV